MAHYTKANGRTVKLTVTASCTMLMVMCIKAIGSKIKQMDRAPTLMQTELSMSEAGRTTSSMDRVLRHGLMAQFMKVCIQKVKSMETES